MPTLGADLEHAPRWITEDCRLHWNTTPRRVLCEVGAAESAANPALARDTADARARTALDATLDAAVKDMLRDYAASASGRREPELTHDGKQHIARIARTVTRAALAQGLVSQTWASASGVQYALAGVDAESFKSVVQGMTSLRPSLRQALTERADARFAEP